MSDLFLLGLTLLITLFVGVISNILLFTIESAIKYFKK